MKRLIAAGVLLVCLAAVVFCSRIAVGHYYEDFHSRLTLCEDEYKGGDKKTAADIAAELKSDWDEAHLRLAAFINRGTVDEIEIAVTRLESFARLQDDNLFLSECEVVRSLLHHMLETERFTLLSVF